MVQVSIHAAREGGDQPLPAAAVPYRRFQSTPPVKAATLEHCVYALMVLVSIHAAREGGDVNVDDFAAEQLGFNPRRP